ncbi:MULTISPECIES: bacillithiol biosynthesis deacetylase BshB1 [unclassified Paenibacillus]|uniref:bacillithiol biosynthesis deacetylase BshB1 n=1 Tax=unclassified Paenibacillus TaxID=185978 RepID=UPI001AE4A430|nr:MULTISPECIES: bacillithiol biosynthesis deacetylase BshB1 [unclassified Paenibacillus]MBP1155294.1 bacillithiol biosynthesis deacetylase BshB1 [Paenibacillus sp. PvP091]MBP1169322.1 bacillithiol biosynthesis deacetylase BshB1 [Paenibacillus sp. PvR098]MBP2440350.1 bacillithiol biosynthesis deacetylase BshB1 [Paenibacillus sp. PvP052]
METLDLLIFGAHPDDAEIGMGGTIAKHTEAGYRVGICDLTLAEMSSNGNVESRRQEAADAAERLGLAMRSNLELPDRGLYLVPEYIERIVIEIRKWKPRVVFAPYWEDRHPDHIACSKLVQEALFNAKLRKYVPHAPAHHVQESYFYFINDVIHPDVMVDVTAVYDKKLSSLRAYRSQFEAAGSGNEYVRTPLNQGYLERVEARDQLLGQQRSVPYAEGFISKLPYLTKLF